MRMITSHTFKDEVLNMLGDISSSSTTVKVTRDGLTDLKHALTVHSDQKLSEPAYQNMFEVLFSVLTRDKALYVRNPTKKPTRDALELASSTLRAGVQHGVKELRAKTVKLLIQHIRGILPHPSEGLCEPLKLDHVRTLRTVLEFAPHIENLPRGEWVDLLEFCCDIILADTKPGEDDEEVQGERPKARSVRTGTRPTLSRDSSSLSRVPVGTNSKLKAEIEEVLVCLQLLLQAPNASIMQPEYKLEELATDAVMSFLRAHKILTSAHVTAYTSLNSILSTISTNNIKLTRSIATELPKLIGRPWELKPGPVLKEEMLISLIHSLPHLRAYIKDLRNEYEEEQLEDIREVLENLLDSFLKEYTESSGKITAEQLQLDEIDFPDPSAPLGTSTPPLTLSSFSLRMDDSTKSELAWMILQIIAMIVSILDMNVPDRGSIDAMDTEESEDSQVSASESRRKKRRKTERSKVQCRFDQILQQASSSSFKMKTVALQLIPFLLEERLRRQITSLNVTEWRQIMADLSLIASEDSTANSNWAMLGIVSAAFLPPATHPSNASFWEQTWKLCSRQASNQSTCRTACHLMRVILSKDLVVYSHISKSIDNILISMDLNGPAILVDSSLDLCSLILERRNRVAQSLLFQPEERLVRWFIARWRPVDGLDRSTSSTAHLNPAKIARFLSLCLGEKGIPSFPVRRYCGNLARAWTKSIDDEKLLNYLLLEGEDVGFQRPVNLSSQPTTQTFAPSLTPDQHRNVTTLLNDFFEREAGNIDELWHSLMTVNSNNVVPSILQNLASFLITATAVITTGTKELGIPDKLKSTLNSIQKQLIGYLQRRDCTEAHVNAVVDLLSPVLPNFHTIFDIDGTPKDIYNGILGEVLRSISKAIETWFLTRGELDDDGDVDMDGFGVPVRRGGAIAARESKSVPREALEAAYCADTDRNSSIILLHMLSWAHKSNALEFSKCFSKYVTHVPTERLLLLKPVVSEVFGTLLVSADDAAEILEHLAEFILQNYEFRVCETAVVSVLSAIDALVPMWVQSDSNPDLVYLCGRIFNWLADSCLEKDTASYSVRMGMAKTLLRILKIDKTFNAGKKSARTYFISLLQDKDIRIKLMMAESVPQLFEIFPLNHHLDLYKDIHSHLDKDVRSIERLALRLYTLSRLATASHATKRRVVWYIFETSTLGENDIMGTEAVEKYATTCVNSLAKTLGLNSAQSLFRAFSSQLIFTWLKAYGLDKIPFKVSGYSTRVELLEDMKEEIVAQLLMNYSEDDAVDLAGHIGISYEHLLTLGFHRIMAYCTACPIATPPLENASKLPPIETRLRKRLGDAVYNKLYSKSFPRIVATLFQTMEQEVSLEKLLSRDPTLSSAKHIMDDIVSISASEAQLGETLQPAFKTKVVLNAFWHLCRKGGYDDGKVWNPAIFTYVTRKLFNSIDPSLGPLHACAVIRKIRLLVCLAGKTVHEGYPLEMLLHGLRPFIVDTICAQDTVGIVQYLFINGKPYLQTNPTFVISTFLSIMASLRTFIATTPNSQIDASQFRSSQGTAQSFHSWLCNYLSDYSSSALSKPNEETFKAIVESAIGFKSYGNAFHGTQEGELLQVLLRDEAEEDGLLDEASRRLAFSLISYDFEKPQTYREDFYGADRDSINASNALLRTCRKYNVSNEYLLWSARVLGRAYAASGTIHIEWTREAELPKVTHLPRDRNSLEIMPKAAILKHLTELLFSEDRQEAGLAEITLNDILEQETQGGEQTLTSELIVSMHHLRALALSPPESPPPVISSSQTITLAGRIDSKSVDDWVTELAITISLNGPPDAVGSRIGPPLQSVEGLAVKVFPYLVHLVLILEERNGNDTLRRALSEVFRFCFQERRESTIPHMMVLINTIVYLRNQEREEEKTQLQRDDWLDLSYRELASAACKCKMFKTALMFVEIHCSREKTDYTDCTNLLLEIYKNIDEPDSYYGLNQGASINTVLNKLEYEQNGLKSLNFRGAQMESAMRLEHGYDTEASVGAIGALNTLGLYGLSHLFLQRGPLGFGNEATLERVYKSAWKLEQWNLPCPIFYDGQAPIIYRALQTVNNTVNSNDVSSQFDSSFLEVMKQVTISKQTGPSLEASIRTLAMLTEAEEVFASRNSVELQEAWMRLENRTPWMRIASFSDVEEMMAIRQTTFSSIAKRQHLQEKANIDQKVARLYEAKALISVCELARSHKILQHALSASTHLNEVSDLCAEVALDISAATTLQTASVFWDQGEALSAIRMLQALENAKLDVIQQDISVGRAELLATLGCWISEARLEKPEVIMTEYHERAIKQLQKEKSRRGIAGRVYHEFALFCDRQLNNQSDIEELERLAKRRESKRAEIEEAERQMRGLGKTTSQYKNLNNHKLRAAKWVSYDDMEYSRLRDNREAFLERSIGNYLSSLELCDDYDEDAIHFCSLWLQYSANEKANKAASVSIDRVESRKFVPLMNQLSSRMLNEDDDFQTLLMELILRICRDHPYHGLYQILSVTKSKNQDPTSHSRASMATNIALSLKRENQFAGNVMSRLHHSITIYMKLAELRMKPEKRMARISIRRALQNTGLDYLMIERDIPQQKLPPPTMNILVRSDCDYSKLPYLQKFTPELSIAGGVSAPKVLTCHDSAGQSYKMLVKGGNDDLRQDTIMEQVFEHVSHLLQRNRQTRQRNLSVRTYKVLPLGVGSGIIEFVPNTTPLHDYLIPAHTAYHPREWTSLKCRGVISDAEGKSREEKVKAFEEILKMYSPVMRYFFMHHFEGPDEWFRSRLAYTRSTAANSMLGWILGLGDRHGHNILLDEKSGEVVHIDLGVAFEQGRVLPIPETVPFRLTRDIIDGMGVTGTEGVFRRCCEFTLSVLRIEKDNITTILDVLRYDPLYNWTISPIKIQKMQHGDRDDTDISVFVKPNQSISNDAEAERALGIVNKKLAGMLSVGATVNELIQQATDVKNLAVLFSGWAAYA